MLSEVGAVHRSMRAAFLETAKFAEPSSALRETEEDVARAMVRGGAVLAEASGETIGSARFAWEPDAIVLARVAVIPAHQGRRVGRSLVGFLEELGRRSGRLVVRTSARSQQPDNRGWWQALGYEIVGYEDVYGVPRLKTLLRKSLPALPESP